MSDGLACRRRIDPTTRERLSRLRTMGRRFSERLADFCPEDLTQIQEIFDAMTVWIDPNIDRIGRRNTDELAVATFARRTIQFNIGFFDQKELAPEI